MFDNETCVSDEIERWSTGLVAFSYLYSTFCILVILITCILWWKYQKRLIYLQKRGFVLMLIVMLGWIASLLSGPIPRSQNKPTSIVQNCILINMSFLLTVPTLILGTCIGVLMFTRRVKLGMLLIKFQANETGKEVTQKKLNRYWFLSTNRFGLIVAFSCYSLILIICFIATYFLCPELGGTECSLAEVTRPEIVLVFFTSYVIAFSLVFYINCTLKTYPDPFFILRSVRNGLGLALMFNIPGIILSTINLGEPTEQETIYFTYGILFDIPILVLCVYFGPFQIYKAFKFDSFKAVYEENDLLKVLRDPTGKKLFKEHLINEFNYENLLFIDDVDSFKALMTQDERMIKASEIFMTHFKYQRLNLPGKVQQLILERFESKDISVKMFDEAYEEVILLLDDPFRRFQLSPVFAVYVGNQTEKNDTKFSQRRGSAGSSLEEFSNHEAVTATSIGVYSVTDARTNL